MCCLCGSRCFQDKLLHSALTPPSSLAPSSTVSSLLSFPLVPWLSCGYDFYFLCHSLTFWLWISDFLSLNAHPPILFLHLFLSILVSLFLPFKDIFKITSSLSVFCVHWNLMVSTRGWPWSMSLEEDGCLERCPRCCQGCSSRLQV